VGLLSVGTSFAQSPSEAKSFKLKIAIGRFSNETVYGRSFLRDGDLDPLGKQASDILTAYLTKTGKFLVFERPDLMKIEREQIVSGQKSNIIGADTLIVGSLVEFGRTEDGKRGFLSRERLQRVHAKVAIRLVDVRTGQVFHSATGVGEATTDTKTVLGIGSASDYDATLTDKAISVAVEDMLENLVNTLSARPWKTDILAVKGPDIYISGGNSQGIHPGDHLVILQSGETIRSEQTGFDITLPAKKIGEIEITSTFGDSETNEGSVARLVSGSLNGIDTKKIYVSTGN
jgi:curli biogenesis system outer membrane secretion channel CsgG